MTLYQQIKALEESIALTEYDLSQFEAEWDSLLVTYNEMTGEAYSAYAEEDEIRELETAIYNCHNSLQREKRQLAALQVKRQQEIEENKKSDEELMRMCEKYYEEKAAEKKEEEK